MSWDEVFVYVLGCLALEQSRDISLTPGVRIALQVHGIACIANGRAASDYRAAAQWLFTPGSEDRC